MRLQHAKLAAGGLPTDEPARKKAKVTIVAEVAAWLHWRIWNGKACPEDLRSRSAGSSHLYKVVSTVIEPEAWHPEKLWHALHEIDKYLRSQSARLVNLTPLDTAPACVSGLR